MVRRDAPVCPHIGPQAADLPVVASIVGTQACELTVIAPHSAYPSVIGIEGPADPMIVSPRQA